MPINRDPAFEKRLDDLRREAQSGRVGGRGVDVADGPMPVVEVKRGGHKDTPRGPAENNARKPGYYGMPIIKPPVWTWEIPLYFFIGGMSGMAGAIAAAAWFTGRFEIARAAMWLAVFGGVVSPVLLIMDLGRPLMFFNMLRIIKIQSPMSMGVYILSMFGTTAIPGAVLLELYRWHLLPEGILTTLLHLAVVVLVIVSALSGIFLATYTGVLIGATVVPVWFHAPRATAAAFRHSGSWLRCRVSRTLRLPSFPTCGHRLGGHGRGSSALDLDAPASQGRGHARLARRSGRHFDEHVRVVDGSGVACSACAGLVAPCRAGVHAWLVTEPHRLGASGQALRCRPGSGVRFAALVSR